MLFLGGYRFFMIWMDRPRAHDIDGDCVVVVRRLEGSRGGDLSAVAAAALATADNIQQV